MSDQERLPIRYRVELYDEAFDRDVLYGVETKDPFLPIHVGDEIDPKVWLHGNALPNDQVYKVTAIRHLLWIIEGNYVAHSLSVAVVAVPRES